MNVAGKNFAEFFIDEKIPKQYLEDIGSRNGWSDKKAILFFFLATLHANFNICQTPRSRFFAKKKLCKYLTKYMKPNILG